MFLIKDRRLGMDHYVFTQTDPRAEGYKGDVTAGVELDYDMNAVHHWPNGNAQPQPQLGLDPKEPKHYKVFKSPDERQQQAYEFVHDYAPFVVHSWSEYRDRYYPVPEKYAKTMTQDEWFDFLEEADSAAEIRRKIDKNKSDDLMPGGTRTQIAEWVARRHMAADGAVQQVWFLDAGSPPDEIRLLEVNERYTGDSAKIEPIDFGLDLGETKYKLLVADVSVAQIKMIKEAPEIMLPAYWKFSDAIGWDRRGRRQ